MANRLQVPDGPEPAGPASRSDRLVQPVVSPLLVGRDDELAAVVARVSAPPSVVVVEGEAGVGKTRLAAELLARPELAGSWRLVGRCREVREPFPLGVVIEALRGAGDALRGLRLGPVAGALRPLVPELAEWLPTALEPLDDRAAVRHRVQRGLAEVLSALGSFRPVVLVLEDLHWADELTREFLAFWLADPTPGTSIVLTYRREDVKPEVPALTARLRGPVGCEHLALAPLDLTTTGALAAAILGIDTVSEEFAGYLRQRTGGLPLAIEEVMALVQAQGLLVPRSGSWQRRQLEELAVPRGIKEPTLQRVARLPEPAQRVVEAAAVLKDPAPVPVLAGTAGLAADGAEMVTGTEQAIDSGLLVEDRAGIAFRHALAAEAVYDRLSGPRRRVLHARAASVLRELSPLPLGRIAYHRRRADDLDAWVDAADAAADQAITLGDDEEAVRLLTEVLAEAPLSADRRGELAIKLGWVALDTLRPRAATGPLSQALAEVTSRQQRGVLRFLLALTLGEADEEDLQRRRSLFLAAIPDLDNRPDLRAWVMVAVAIGSPPDVPWAEDLQWVNRALDEAASADDPQLEVFVAAKAGALLVLHGDRKWRSVTDRVLELNKQAPRQRRDVSAYYSIGVSACYAGHLATAESLLSSGLKASATAENQRLEMQLRGGLALLHLFQGSWTGLAAEALVLREVVDYASLRIDIELVAGYLALARGDLAEAGDRLSAASQLTCRTGSYEAAPVAAVGAAEVALARGDLPGALSCLNMLLDAVQAKGVLPTVCWALPSAVQIWAAAGEGDQARQFLHEAAGALRGLDAPLAEVATLHSRGILSGSAPDLMAAADLYQAASVPFLATRAREEAAAVLLAARQDSAAQVPLRQALAGYRSLGASWYYDRAVALARRHGVSVPSRQRGGVRRRYELSLSPREREVAELAASGRTNKQIAAELFVSARTVDHHVAAAMRKLGVQSRSALTHKLTAATSEEA